jgi:hypothetical protein
MFYDRENQEKVIELASGGRSEGMLKGESEELLPLPGNFRQSRLR